MILGILPIQIDILSAEQIDFKTLVLLVDIILLRHDAQYLLVSGRYNP